MEPTGPVRKIALFAIVPMVIVAVLAGWSQARRSGSDDSRDHDSWRTPDSEEHRKNPVLADAASLAEGKKLYQTYCAACHGEKGRGDGPAGAALTPRPADLAHEAPHERDGELAWKIATGRPPMPAWKGVLTETQIWHVVNYIKHGFGPAGGGRREREEHR